MAMNGSRPGERAPDGHGRRGHRHKLSVEMTPGEHDQLKMRLVSTFGGETAEAARQAALGSRFRDDPESDTHAGSETPQPPARTPRRKEPPGKVRRTYYLSQDSADALDQAVEQIRTALGGRIDRHEVLGAVITAGAAQTGQIIADMRAELLRTLADETPEASPEA